MTYIVRRDYYLQRMNTARPTQSQIDMVFSCQSQVLTRHGPASGSAVPGRLPTIDDFRWQLKALKFVRPERGVAGVDERGRGSLELPRCQTMDADARMASTSGIIVYVVVRGVA